MSLDGTKVKANASKHCALSWGHANRIEKQLKAEVDELMHLAEEADAEDIPDGMSLPKDLGEVDTLVADTGYFSEKNVNAGTFYGQPGYATN